jgi:AcrR family transcriptional regulator
MSSAVEIGGARLPKRQRGKQRVAELLNAAAAIFGEKGYEAATMTEIAARAGAPIGSLYQFFPSKEVLADTLVQNYVALLESDLQELERRAKGIDTDTLVRAFFTLMRGHPQERTATLQLVEARMDEQTLLATFRSMFRRRLAAVLRARTPALPAEAARDTSVVVLQLMKAASALSDEEGLPSRSGALREIHALTEASGSALSAVTAPHVTGPVTLLE